MRDILSEYGRDSNSPQEPRATSGGAMKPKPTSYSPPQGPLGINKSGPGLHGDNHGMAQCPVAGNGEGGHAGISHEKHPHGSQK